MRKPGRFRRWCLVLIGTVIGCHPSPAPPADTGSLEVARQFYEALRRQDWPQAYALLIADQRRVLSSALFARLAANYRGAVGFEPREVHVRAHEEHGSEAIVHVVFVGEAGGRRRYYKDAVILRQDGSAWFIVIPGSFGRMC
jgi:hypothetical protein